MLCHWHTSGLKWCTCEDSNLHAEALPPQSSVYCQFHHRCFQMVACLNNVTSQSFKGYQTSFYPRQHHLKLAITEDDYHSVKISLSQLFPNLPSELDDHDISVLGLIKWSSGVVPPHLSPKTAALQAAAISYLPPDDILGHSDWIRTSIPRI